MNAHNAFLKSTEQMKREIERDQNQLYKDIVEEINKSIFLGEFRAELDVVGVAQEERKKVKGWLEVLGYKVTEADTFMMSSRTLSRRLLIDWTQGEHQYGLGN